MAVDRIAGLIRRTDWMLLGVTILLVAIGLATLFSITLNVEQPRAEKFFRQLVSFAVGLIALGVGMVIDFRLVRSLSWALYGLGLALLAGVLMLGTTFRGTTGWFSFLGTTFQPVEAVKVIIIIVLARYLAEHRDQGVSWRVILRTGLLVGFPAALVMLQPDLGSAMLLIAAWLILLVVEHLPWRKLAVILVGLSILLGASWFLLQGYQRDRILTFLDPQRDPLRSGYNVRQSIVAIGSGQLFGRGLGLGTQSQLNFLPTQDTDFIFAVVAEELGFVGTTVLLGLFGVFLWRLSRGITLVRDPFGSVLFAGSFVLFAIEVSINIGGTLGIVPLTGTPLPFLSYGGSALISSLFLVGVCLGVLARSSGSSRIADGSP